MIVCASYGRLKSGLFATLLCSLIVIEHTYSNHAPSNYLPYIINLSLFILSGIWLSIQIENKYQLINSLHRSIAESDELHFELSKHQEELEGLVAERTSEIQLTQDIVIECMIKTAEFRSSEIGGHIARTRSYAQAIVDKMSTVPVYKEILSPEFVQNLIKCAPLHDIGKAVVPDAILLKPNKLTDEEFELVKTHTVTGANILSSAEQKFGEQYFLRLAIQMAVSHHENWDGSGYPYGISGENIPLVGRIMAIADVYDALVSDRVYRPGMTHEQAVDIIIREKGTKFDPELIDIFVLIKDEFEAISRRYQQDDPEDVWSSTNNYGGRNNESNSN